LQQQVVAVAKEDPTAAVEGILQILSSLTPEQRQLLLAADKLKSALNL